MEQKKVSKKSTYTLTFGDQAENHHGMQKIGNKLKKGISCKKLNKLYEKLKEEKWNVKLVNLNKLVDVKVEGKENEEETRKEKEETRKEEEITYDPASILIIRDGVSKVIGEDGLDNLYKEMKIQKCDTKAYMRGRVVNKHARHNLCFGEESQEPDYENKKGTIVAFDKVPFLNELKSKLSELIIYDNLVCELNKYFDIDKCGIGYHGDSERRIVVGVRLGASMPLCYQWFLNSKPVGKKKIITLNHGDIYIMSEKAVGTDWLKKKIPTLRHAAGCDKFTIYKK